MYEHHRQISIDARSETRSLQVFNLQFLQFVLHEMLTSWTWSSINDAFLDLFSWQQQQAAAEQAKAPHQTGRQGQTPQNPHLGENPLKTKTRQTKAPAR